MSQMRWSCLVLALGLFACGPAGKITGRVTVEGGDSAGIAVFAYGPSSGATVTGADGAFTFAGLPDGEYVVRATVRDADVEEASASTTITQGGTAAPEPVLNFKASSATVTGKVVFADGSEASNLSVIATGPETVGTRTETNGSFSFTKIKNGAYVISVEVRDTREGRVGIGVDASGTKDVGELRLTPVGQLKGVVSYGGMPAEGVSVFVPGTSTSATTDAQGVFALVNVPTGTQTVVARVGAEPFWRSATVVTTVGRGVNTDLAITITDDAPKTGTVQGNVTFRGPRNPRDILLSVPGTAVTGNPSANGTFALTVPVGEWEVIATAPSHPKLSLGRVVVREGLVTQLPGAMLSAYRSIWRSNANVTLGGGVFPGVSSHSWSIVTVDDGSQRLAIVHALTGELRFLAVGSFNAPVISNNAKYVGWSAGRAVFVYELATGALTAHNDVETLSSFTFSSDESTLFVVRSPSGGRTLRRIPLANPMAAVTFPATGVSTDIRSQSSDRWFVREGPAAPTSDFRLVTTTMEVASAFTDVSSLQLTPTAWAYTNCTASCTMKVLSPTSTAAAVTVSGISPAPGSLFVFNGSSGEHPCYGVSTSNVAFCVKSADGTRYPLPSDVLQLAYNLTGTRMIYTYNTGIAVAVREEAVPPSSSTTDLDTVTTNWRVGWLSATRAYAAETGSAAGRKVRIVTNGTAAAVDTDIGTQSILPSPPLFVFPQQTTGKWRAILGDGPTRPLDIDLTINPSLSVRSLSSDTITRFASVQPDNVTAHVIDETAGMVRVVNEGTCSGGLRSSAMELCIGYRPGGGDLFMYHYQTGASIEYLDNSVSPQTYVGSQVTGLGVLGLSLDQREIVLATIAP